MYPVERGPSLPTPQKFRVDASVCEGCVISGHYVEHDVAVSSIFSICGRHVALAEQDRPDSQFGDLIWTHIREGKIVPMEVTIKLLENVMHAVLESKSGEGWGDGKGRFLIDGFPRKMDQALKFEEDVRLTDVCTHPQVC